MGREHKKSNHHDDPEHKIGNRAARKGPERGEQKGAPTEFFGQNMNGVGAVFRLGINSIEGHETGP